MNLYIVGLVFFALVIFSWVIVQFTSKVRFVGSSSNKELWTPSQDELIQARIRRWRHDSLKARRIEVERRAADYGLKAWEHSVEEQLLLIEIANSVAKPKKNAA